MRTQIFRALWLPPLVIAAIGIALSLAVFSGMRSADEAHLRSDLALRVEWRARDFERKIELATNSLEALALFMAAQKNVDAASFHSFARLLHDANDSHTELDWAPWVNGAERDAFVAAARKSVAPDYDITDMTADGRIVPAATRDAYIPTLYQETFNERPGPLGRDGFRRPEIKAVVLAARDQARPLAFPPLPLQFGAERKLGFSVLWPVYATGTAPATVAERQAGFLGLAISRFRLDRMLSAAIAGTPKIVEAIDVAIDGGSEDAKPIRVAHFDPDRGQFLFDAAADHPTTADIVLTREFDVLGRHLTLTFGYAPLVVAPLRSSSAWIWLILGLALTGMASAFALREQMRRSVVEAAIKDRTAALTQEVELRRRQELAAQASAARLQMVVDTVVHGVIITDDKGSILLFSAAAERLFGYSAAEIVGQKAMQLLPPPFGQEYDSYLRNFRQTGNHALVGINREAAGRRKDGSTFPMELAIGQGRQDGAPIFVAVVSDISERKAIERQLQLSEERYRQLIDKLPNGIVIHVDGKIVFANPAVARLLGADRPEQLLGMPALDILHPDDRAAAVQNIRAALQGAPTGAPVERRILRFDGSIAVAELDAIPMPFGDKPGLLIVANDITSRKAAEVARLEIEAQLRQAQKMEAIGNLTGGMAHDFNNLLGVIIGNLDIAQPLAAKLGDAGERINDAIEAALRGADLTRRLLAFARRQPLQPRPIAVNELVAGLVKLLRRTIGEDIEISLELASDVWPVVADPTQVESAMVNLATNARDAMPSGGRLIIATANAHLDADYAAQHADVTPGDYVVIAVSDTGTGMTADVMSRIFEPFFTTKETDKGSGLGLSMVFGFMKQSGGHVNVYSELGVGTTFRLYLPRAAAAATVAREAGTLLPPDAKGETVLAVEDNDALLRVVELQLQKLGYRVLQAKSAAEALAVLEQEKVDLLFTDIVMPGEMDGYALARAALSRWPHLKVVLTSGFPEARINGNLGPQASSARLLSKPYRREDLARALREALDAP